MVAQALSLHGPELPVPETRRTRFAAALPPCAWCSADHLPAAPFNFSKMASASGTPPGYKRQPIDGSVGTGRP